MKIFMIVLASCSALGALLLPGCAQNSESRSVEARRGAHDSIRVGRVEMEALFHAYRKAEDFYEKAEEIQLRFEELGEDDFEEMMKLQGEFQFVQMEFFQGFQEDVEKTAAKVGADLDLHLVTVDVLFGSEKTEIIDVTGHFMETELFGSAGPTGHTHSESCGPECE